MQIVQNYKNMSVSAKAGIWFIACNCLQAGMKYLMLAVFTHIMPVGEYGIVTLYTSWTQIILIFATLSLGSANGVFYVAMAEYADNRDPFTSAMHGLIVTLCVVCFSVIGLSVVLFGDWMKIGLMQYPAMCIELAGYGNLLLWTLRQRYDNQYRALAGMMVLYSFGVSIVSVISVMLCPEGVSPAVCKIWSTALSTLAVGGLATFQSWKRAARFFHKQY